MNDILRLFPALLLTLAAGACRAQTPPPLDGLDGTIIAAETATADSVHAEEGTIYVHRVPGLLRLSVRSEALYVASLCVASADTVVVLHASAALGALHYVREGDTWRRAGSFTWALRDTSRTPEALRARERYLAQNGWVATTMPMGRAGEVEFVLAASALPAGPLTLAAGLMPSDRPESTLPVPASSGACADAALVAGSPPDELPFAPADWPALPLRPRP